jgi:hypothetical protein
MPMYGQKKAKITGTATSKPAAKKTAMPAKPSASMTKMNKSKPAEITKGQATRAVKPASKIKPRKGMM